MVKVIHKPGMVYISSKYKLVFVPIPKNGSTTIRMLRNAEFYQTILQPEDIETLRDYTWFAIRRDPIERFISAYLESRNRGYNNFTFQYIFERDLKISLTSCICELEKGIFDPHFQSQSALLGFFEDFGIAIELLDFSELREDANKFFMKNDLPLKVTTQFKRYSQDNYRNYSHMCRRFIKMFYLLCKRFIRSRSLTAIQRQELYLIFRGVGSRISYLDLMPNKVDILLLLSGDETLLRRIQDLYRDDLIRFAG